MPYIYSSFTALLAIKSPSLSMLISTSRSAFGTSPIIVRYAIMPMHDMLLTYSIGFCSQGYQLATLITLGWVTNVSKRQRLGRPFTAEELTWILINICAQRRGPTSWHLSDCRNRWTMWCVYWKINGHGSLLVFGKFMNCYLGIIVFINHGFGLLGSWSWNREVTHNSKYNKNPFLTVLEILVPTSPNQLSCHQGFRARFNRHKLKNITNCLNAYFLRYY